MNEELQQALAEMITSSVSVAGDALAFTKEQLPEVVQQLLVWRLFHHGAGMMLALAFLFAAILTASWMRSKRVPDAEDQGRFEENMFWDRFGRMETPQAFAWIWIVIGACLGVTGVIIDFMNLMQIWLAPKVYLIEYAANLAK